VSEAGRKEGRRRRDSDVFAKYFHLTGSIDLHVDAMTEIQNQRASLVESLQPDPVFLVDGTLS
jgi:hypothetical protein